MATVNDALLGLSGKFKTFTKTEFMPTGSLVMDIVMGGGLPVGKIIELTSDAGAGKSTIALSMCRELLINGKKVIYLDYEGAVTTSQLKGIFGNNPKTGENYLDEFLYTPENPDGNFILFQVTTYMQGEEILNNLLGTDEFALVVIDSVTSMVPDEYLESVKNPNSKDAKYATDDNRPAIDARLVGRFLKKFKAVCTEHNVSMFLINQMRTALSLTSYGTSSKKTTGGAAVEYMPDIRIRLEKSTPITQKKKNNLTGEVEEQRIGSITLVNAYKNKLGPGMIKVPVSIIFGRGISNLQSYRQWLPNKTIRIDGEDKPMLETRGGGYHTLLIPDANDNINSYQVRGEDALMDLITKHFDDIKRCFGPEDFTITENKGYAEFDENNVRSVEIKPDESFEVDALGEEYELDESVD